MGHAALAAKHPTLEIRICDICTWAEDGLTIAALYQSILSFLAHLKANNQRWRHYRRILILENKWRAQRYGVEARDGRLRQAGAGAVPGPGRRDGRDPAPARRGARTASPRSSTPGSWPGAARSADHQLKVYHAALEGGASDHEAQVAVVDWLIEQSVTPDGPPRPETRLIRRVALSGARTPMIVALAAGGSAMANEAPRTSRTSRMTNECATRSLGAGVAAGESPHPAVARLLAGGPPAPEAVDAFLAEQEFPLAEPGLLTFAWRGEADQVHLVRWIHGGGDRRPFARLPGTDLWLLRLPVEDGGRFEYKLAIGAARAARSWIVDPLNPARAGDPFGENSVAAPSATSGRTGACRAARRRGGIEEMRVESRAFGEARERAGLPAGGPRPGRRLSAGRHPRRRRLRRPMPTCRWCSTT